MLILFNIYLSLLGITTLFGLVRIKKLTSPFRLLTLLIVYVFFIELAGRTMVYLSWKNTFPFYHFSAFVLITLTALIYVRLVEYGSRARRLIAFISICCAALAVINSMFHQPLSRFPSFSIAAHAFQSILLALVIFNETIKAPTLTPLVKQSLFWLNCGTFLFYSSNFVGFVLFNEYYQLQGITTTWIFYLNWIGNMVIYSCYFVALYLDQKHPYER